MEKNFPLLWKPLTAKTPPITGGEKFPTFMETTHRQNATYNWWRKISAIIEGLGEVVIAVFNGYIHSDLTLGTLVVLMVFPDGDKAPFDDRPAGVDQCPGVGAGVPGDA